MVIPVAECGRVIYESCREFCEFSFHLWPDCAGFDQTALIFIRIPASPPSKIIAWQEWVYLCWEFWSTSWRLDQKRGRLQQLNTSAAIGSQRYPAYHYSCARDGIFAAVDTSDVQGWRVDIQLSRCRNIWIGSCAHRETRMAEWFMYPFLFHPLTAAAADQCTNDW